MSGSEAHGPVGFGVEDLALFRRELFDAALAAVRDAYDPVTDSARFSEALWAQLGRVFEWREQPPERDGTPGDRQAYADGLAAVVRERFGIDLDVDYTPRS